MRAPLVCVAVLQVLFASVLWAQDIFLSSYTGGYCGCTLNHSSRFYIVANTTYGGVQGAEFSVEGFPTELGLTLIPHPSASTLIGDPFGDGAQIGFSACQEGFVVLYEVEVQYPAVDVEPFIAQVRNHKNPSNPLFECPALYMCDAPVFTQICASGRGFASGFIYPSVSQPDPATGAENVQIDPVLTWDVEGPCFECCITQYEWDVLYFGENPVPPRVQENSGGVRQYEPGVLKPNTQYYWQVRSCVPGCEACTTSPVWSFTTGEAVAVFEASWRQIKSLYR